MIDGPGPPGTDTVAVRAPPASVAVMTSGPDGTTSGIRDTHKILLFRSCSGGACSASRGAHKIATMLPACPSTCGMAWSAGLNPDRAQTGSGPTAGCPAHPAPATAPATAPLA